MITLSTMQSLNESVSYNPYDDIPLEDLGSVVESATAIALNEGVGHDIWEGIKALWSKLVELVRALVTKIKNFFSSLLNRGGKSADALKAKADKIPDDAVVDEAKALGKAKSEPKASATSTPATNSENKPAESKPQETNTPDEPKETMPEATPTKLDVSNDVFFLLASSNSPLTDATISSVILASSDADAEVVKRATGSLISIEGEEAMKSWTKSYEAMAAAKADLSDPKIRNAAGFRKVDNDWVMNVFKAVKGVPKSGKKVKSMVHDYYNSTKDGAQKLGSDINKYCDKLYTEYSKTQKQTDAAARESASNYTGKDPNLNLTAKMYKAQANACSKALSVVTNLCSAYCGNIRNVVSHSATVLNNYINASTVSDSQKTGLRKLMD